MMVVVNWGLGVVEKGCSGERRDGAMIKGRMEGRKRRVERRAAILSVYRVDAECTICYIAGRIPLVY